MPLIKGKSKAAFRSNVATETKAGEAKGMSPEAAAKRGVAIAYSEAGEKRKRRNALADAIRGRR